MPNRTYPIQCAIVGGGYAGICTLVQLIERFGEPLDKGRLQVRMFEKGPDPGPGLAWDGAVASDCQLTNLNVSGLQLSDDFHPTFHDWLLSTYPERFAPDPALAGAFPPRRYFGEYLRAMLEQLAARRGVEVRSGVEVVGVNSGSHGGYRITTRDPEEEFDAELVFVCTGAPTPGPAVTFPHLAGAPGCVDCPWPATRMTAAVAGADRVAVIGTGLTAVDVVKQLAVTAPELPLVLTSRRGRFNAVYRDLSRPEIRNQPPYQRVVLTDALVAALPDRLPLNEMLDLLKREVEASTERPIDWEQLADPNLDGVVEWRQRMRDHEQGRPCRWQLALLAIDDVFPLLWRRLDDDDRRRWLQSPARMIYQNYSNPLPFASARAVVDLIDKGRAVVRAGLRGIEARAGGGFQLLYADGDLEVTHCINATGVGLDVSHDPSPLTRQLLADGLVERHPLGGFQLDPASCAARPGLYFIGNHGKGVRYLTSGIGFVRSMAVAALDDVGVLVKTG